MNLNNDILERCPGPPTAPARWFIPALLALALHTTVFHLLPAPTAKPPTQSTKHFALSLLRRATTLPSAPLDAAIARSRQPDAALRPGSDRLRHRITHATAAESPATATNEATPPANEPVDQSLPTVLPPVPDVGREAIQPLLDFGQRRRWGISFTGPSPASADPLFEEARRLDAQNQYLSSLAISIGTRIAHAQLQLQGSSPATHCSVTLAAHSDPSIDCATPQQHAWLVDNLDPASFPKPESHFPSAAFLIAIDGDGALHFSITRAEPASLAKAE
ncbi:hypothetical protein [Chitinivorax sp. B]|uniref:hypothetical protein n=1 Tax=Chitinivorax sp. B TaxID=2502235 RepID=UPI0010F6B4C1|nr:hypothetical protein [Chitinivorax sp. B]